MTAFIPPAIDTARSDDTLILALDQGTSSSRALLFDRSGRPIGIAQREVAPRYPRPGWVEHDADEIWRSQLEVARQVLAECRVAASRIRAIGLSNQRETTVLWDRASGEPVAPAIVWQDRRTAAQCEALSRAGHDALVRSKTGLVIDPYFSATKLAWMLDELPGLRARAERGELAFGTVDSWLIYKLSGQRRHVTDVSNASRTLLFNIETHAWDDALLALFNIPRALLPEVVSSSGEIADTDARWLGRALPITGVAGDQQAATFGQACVMPGMVKNTYGTGLFMLLNTGERPIHSTNRLVTTIGWRLGARATTEPHTRHTHYALEGSIFMGGAIIQWLRDGLRIIDSAPQVDALAAACDDTGGVVLVPAFAGLGAPHWDPRARGTLLGMTRGTGRPQIARAALEAIALQTVDVLQAMQRDAGAQVSVLRADGGAAASDLLMQIQADLLGVPVVRPQVTETTAAGAAYLAGLGVGYWADTEEIAALWRAERTFVPNLSDDLRQARIALWRRAIERARGWEE